MVTTDDWRPKRTPGRTRGWAKAKENTSADRSQIDKEQGTFACKLCRKQTGVIWHENSHTGARRRTRARRFDSDARRFGDGARRSDSVRDGTIRCETERYGARRGDTVRDETIRARYAAIRRDTRRSECDTDRYRCETVRYRCETVRYRVQEAFSLPDLQQEVSEGRTPLLGQ